MKNYILGKITGYVFATLNLIIGIFAAIGVSYMAEKIEKTEEEIRTKEEDKQNIK